MDPQIKETMELLASLNSLVDGLAKVLADGKVGITDIVYLPGIISGLRDGLEGVKKVPAEVSHLSKENLEVVMAAVIALGLNAYDKLVDKNPVA